MANREPPAASRPAVSNRLLAALPSDDYGRVASRLDVIPLKLREILHKPGDAIREIYFPGGGFLSLLTVLKDGNMVEVATVGREGMAGISTVLSNGPSPSMTMVQAETDTCYKMAAKDFRDEMSLRGAFHELLTRYAHANVAIIMQSTACNALHSVEQRLCRWLLLAHDRIEKDEFLLTQEFVAIMLGATRPAVTIVAGTLQKAGLITYHRGHVTIMDREKLEAASCECYRVVTDLVSAVYAQNGH